MELDFRLAVDLDLEGLLVRPLDHHPVLLRPAVAAAAVVLVVVVVVEGVGEVSICPPSSSLWPGTTELD